MMKHTHFFFEKKKGKLNYHAYIESFSVTVGNFNGTVFSASLNVFHVENYPCDKCHLKVIKSPNFLKIEIRQILNKSL